MQKTQFICVTRDCTYPKIITDDFLIHSENSHQIISLEKLKDKIQHLYPEICSLQIDNIKQRVGELLMQYVQSWTQPQKWGLIQLIQNLNNNSLSESDLKSQYFNELVDCYNDKKQLLYDFEIKEQIQRIKDKLNSLSQQIYKLIQEGSQSNEQTPTPQPSIIQTEPPQAKLLPQPHIEQSLYEFEAYKQQNLDFLRFGKNNTQIHNSRKENVEQIALIQADMTKFHQIAFQLQKPTVKIGVLDYSKIECITSDNLIGKCIMIISDDQNYIYFEKGKEEIPFDIKIGSLFNLEWDPQQNSLSFLCSKKKKKRIYLFEKTDVSHFQIVVWLGPGAQIQVQAQ